MWAQGLVPGHSDPTSAMAGSDGGAPPAVEDYDYDAGYDYDASSGSSSGSKTGTNSTR